MLAAALITFGEGLEAALIIGIILAVLRQVNRPDWRSAVWWGVATAAALSLIAGLALYAVGAEMEGRAEETFEGAAMLLAAGFLTWMIFWMQSQGRQIKERLEADTKQALSTGQRGRLFGLAFLAVGREGFETVLFLSAVDSGVVGKRIVPLETATDSGVCYAARIPPWCWSETHSAQSCRKGLALRSPTYQGQSERVQPGTAR
jgi:high-affinity iron transporter